MLVITFVCEYEKELRKNLSSKLFWYMQDLKDRMDIANTTTDKESILAAMENNKPQKLKQLFLHKEIQPYMLSCMPHFYCHIH